MYKVEQKIISNLNEKRLKTPIVIDIIAIAGHLMNFVYQVSYDWSRNERSE